jgi:hypothetical protein
MKKTSHVLMSSSLGKIVSHMWVCEVKGGRLGEGVRLVACWAVDFQHGSRVERGLHHALMATTPTVFFLHLKTPHINTSAVYYCKILYIFSPFEVKNKSREGVTLSYFWPVSLVAYRTGINIFNSAMST